MQIQITMQLMMYVGNDFIEAVNVQISQLSQPGYLGKFKRTLKQKHAELLLQSGTEAEFLLIDPAPKTITNPSSSAQHTQLFHQLTH